MARRGAVASIVKAADYRIRVGLLDLRPPAAANARGYRMPASQKKPRPTRRRPARRRGRSLADGRPRPRRVGPSRARHRGATGAALAKQGSPATRPHRAPRPARRKLHRAGRRSIAPAADAAGDARRCHAPRASPRLLAQALNRRAFVEIRGGRSRDAVRDAPTPHCRPRAARKDATQEAMALYRLGEAQFRIRDSAAGGDGRAPRLRAMFKALGQTVNEGRARWAVVRRAQRPGARRRRRTAPRARRWRWHGAAATSTASGNALNMLTFHEPDIAKRASACSAVAGGVRGGRLSSSGRRVITHNLGEPLQRARAVSARAPLAPAGRATPTGASGAVGTGLAHDRVDAGGHASTSSGIDDAAEGEPRVGGRSLGSRRDACGRGVSAARATAQIALWEDDRARRPCRPARGRRRASSRATTTSRILINALTGRSEACLAAGEPPARWPLPSAPSACIARTSCARSRASMPTDVWWRHTRRCAPTASTRGARRALAIAYRFLVEPISKLTDEGLRRNYLNKVEVHRKIVDGTLARARGASPAVPRILRARRACRSRSSGWSTPACA